MLWSIMAKTSHWCMSIGMHKALTARTDLPDVELLVEHKNSGSKDAEASVRTGGVTVGPKC